jgi:hypothetical protein
MLFTATSEEATNTVTLGNAAINLEEYVDEDDESPRDSGYAVVGDDYDGTNPQATTIPGEEEDEDLFQGLDFGNVIIPGGKLEKRPRVVNTGNIPVYVYVDGVLEVTDADGNAFVLDLAAPGAEKTDENIITDQILSILATAAPTMGDNGTYKWLGTPQWNINNGIITGQYFLVKTGGTDAEYTLAALEAGVATPDIFSEIRIPVEVNDDLQGYTISLKLIAYAVQSGNNDVETIEDLVDLF